MISKTFINEIGNKIRIKIKKYKGTGTNYKNKTKHNYNGIEITMTGPTSEMTNEITLQEAIELHQMLGLYIKKINNQN